MNNQYIIILFLIAVSITDRKLFKNRPIPRIVFWTFVLIIYFLPLIFENQILPFGSYGVPGLVGAIALPIFYIWCLYNGIKSKMIKK